MRRAFALLLLAMAGCTPQTSVQAEYEPTPEPAIHGGDVVFTTDEFELREVVVHGHVYLVCVSRFTGAGRGLGVVHAEHCPCRVPPAP